MSEQIPEQKPQESEAFEAIVEPGAELVPVSRGEVRVSNEDKRLSRIRAIEDELLQTNMQIMRDVACFRDITPDTVEPPKEWIDELGFAEAEKRLRVARAAWMPPKEAPVALMMAKAVSIGIIKARSSEKMGPRTLNVAMVHMAAPAMQFAEKELEDGLQRR